MLVTDSADFGIRKIIRNKEEHFIMINESIHQKDIKTLNIYIYIYIYIYNIYIYIYIYS